MKTMWKIILQPRLQQQSCVDIVKAIKLMLQRGLVPESWTQSYWKDGDIGNVMSFDEACARRPYLRRQVIIIIWLK